MESLHATTLRLLDARIASKQITLLDLHKETGLSFYWLRKFKSREVPDPSVNRVQRLYEYLVSHPLEL